MYGPGVSAASGLAFSGPEAFFGTEAGVVFGRGRGVFFHFGRGAGRGKLLTGLGIAGTTTPESNSLSGGECQRVFIALALLHRPEVVFLDELTTALDPQACLAMWDVEVIRDRGTSVVLTTHYMEEAERLCDRVGIIDRGWLIALDTVPALIADHAGDATARLTFDKDPPAYLNLEAIDSVTAFQSEARHLSRAPLIPDPPFS